MKPNLLTLFVALPGTHLGDAAHWKNPEDLKVFYEKVRAALTERLARPVELIMEKERRRSGVVHATMFREAWKADVFIADLTGHNPNVFLELGVRYALRRGVTVIVSQDTAKIPFNVESMRAIQYADRPDEFAIDKIVDFVEQGLAGDEQYNDSPVLQFLDLVPVPRERWEQVSGLKVQTLLSAAQNQSDPEGRLPLLREAVEADPLSVEARYRYGWELRQLGRYKEAIDVFTEGTRLDPIRSVYHQERGLALGRIEDLEGAVAALRKAVRLAPKDTDVLSTLGGALRRLGMRDAPREYHREALVEALAQYSTANEMSRYDTYTGLNVLKLELLTSRWDQDAQKRAEFMLEKMRHLTAFEVADKKDKPKLHWRLFDLADTQVLSGCAKEASETYLRALSLVDLEHRAEVVQSPLRSLEELQRADVLRGRAKSGVDEIIGLLKGELESTQAS